MQPVAMVTITKPRRQQWEAGWEGKEGKAAALMRESWWQVWKREGGPQNRGEGRPMETQLGEKRKMRRSSRTDIS